MIDAKWQRALAPYVTVSARRRTYRYGRRGLRYSCILLQLRGGLIDLITFTSFMQNLRVKYYKEGDWISEMKLAQGRREVFNQDYFHDNFYA